MNRLSTLATAFGLTLTVIAAVNGAEIARTSAHEQSGDGQLPGLDYFDGPVFRHGYDAGKDQ